jgi:hypothetical protein
MNAVSEAHGSPTRVGPLKASSSHCFAGWWNELPVSTAYSSTLASTITGAIHVIEQLEGLGHVRHVDAQAKVLTPLAEPPPLRSPAQARSRQLVHCFAQADVPLSAQLLRRRSHVLVEPDRRTHISNLASVMYQF